MGNIKQNPLLRYLNTGRWVILACAGIALLIIFTPATPSPYVNSHLNTHIASIKTPPAIAFPVFIDATLNAGLFSGHLQGGKRLTGLNETLGAGACALDFDNDGWLDLFIISGTGQNRYYGRSEWWQQRRGNRLYKNLANGRFEDVSIQAGIKGRAWGLGCGVADFDNDGYADLVVTNYGANQLFQNNGDGSFRDVTNTSGLVDNQWSTGVAIADYDGDGLLDMYITNYIRYKKGARTFESSTGFVSLLSPAFDSTLYDSQANRLYRNLGNFRFEDVTNVAGVANASGRSLSALWQDINEDRFPDLIVVNDRGLPNAVYINEGNGKFFEAAANYRLNTTLGNLGITTGDLDNDGDLDLAMSTPNTQPIALYLRNSSSLYGVKGSDSTSEIFIDHGRLLGLNDERFNALTSWSLGLHDFNNDGWLDLFSSNGLTSADPDNYRIPQGQPNGLWLNQGQGRLRPCINQCGVALNDKLSSRGAVFADFDNDGDMDSFITQNNGLGQLLINTGPQGNWLGVALVGTKDNRDALGARVSISMNSGTQVRIASRNPSFLSTGDNRLHFGLAENSNVNKLIVMWPNGDHQSFKNIVVNQYITITQGTNSYTVATPTEPAPQALVNKALMFKQEANRLMLAPWLAQHGYKEMAQAIFLQASQSTDAKVRRSVIDYAQQYKSHFGLTLLVQGLKDASLDNRLAAIQGLRDYEEEISIRWLLRLFNNSHPKIQCALARNFEFYFREEEAVILRKFLALPYLLDMLKHKNAKVRTCAARALAEAEHYRGLQPLLALLDDPGIEVRVQAVRALGRIREREAISPLLELYRSSNQPAKIKAMSLISLQRLNYRNMEELITGSLEISKTNEAKQQLITALQTFKLLIEDKEDGTVINAQFIAQAVNDWLIRHRYYSKPLRDNAEHIIPLALDIFRQTHFITAGDKIKTLARSRNAVIRANAFATLIDLRHPQARALAIRGIKDPNREVRIPIYKALLGTHLKIPVKDILPGLKDPHTRLLAIQLLSHYNVPMASQKLYQIAVDPVMNSTTRLMALEGLISHDITTRPLPKALYSNDNALLHAAALRYWAKQSSGAKQISAPPDFLETSLQDPDEIVQHTAVDALLSRHEAWATQLIRTVLLDMKRPIAFRQNVLEKIIEKKKAGYEQLILRLARLLHDPISISAMRHLGRFSTHENTQYLKRIVENPSRQESQRLAAAQALYETHPQWLIKKLTDNHSSQASP